MRKCSYLILSLLITAITYGQLNYSNISTPIAIPPPMPIPKDTVPVTGDTTDHDDNCLPKKKLSAFSLPCCIDYEAMVSVIAKTEFAPQSDCRDPRIIYTPSWLALSGGQSVKTVTASDGQNTLTATTIVVDPNVGLEGTAVQVPIENWSKKLEKIMELLKNNQFPGTCDPQLEFSGGINIKKSFLCCGNSCVKESFKFSGNFAASFGASCHLPVYGIPWFAALDAVISANATANISPNFSLPCQGGKGCVDFGSNLNIGGGAGFTLAAGALRASIQVIGGGGFNGNWCFYPEVENIKGDWQINPLKLVGTVTTAWGMSTHNIEYVIFNGF